VILQNLMRSPAVDLVDQSAVVPGLKVVEIFHILTEEQSWSNYMADNAVAELVVAFLRTQLSKPVAWRDVSVKERAIAAHQVFQTYFAFDQEEADRVSGAQTENCGHLLLSAVTGSDLTYGTRDDALWLKVVKLAATKKSHDGTDFPYGRHPEYFQAWYETARDATAPLLDQLTNALLHRAKGFSSDLVPPSSVMEHIVEFALDPELISPPRLEDLGTLGCFTRHT